jgi:rod shape determining protein RodA
MPVKPKILVPKGFERRHSVRDAFVRFFGVVNVPLLVIAAIVTAYGLLVVYSSTFESVNHSFIRQVMGVAIGAVVMVLLWSFNYHRLADWVIPLLVITFILLLMPLLPVIGTVVNGARSWVTIFGQQLQPGEPAKILTIIIMAALVSKYRGKLTSGKEFLKCLGLLLALLLAIMLQPDFGTGMVLFAIGFTILLTGGARWKWLLITTAAIAVLVTVVFNIDPMLDRAFGSDVLLKEYQRNRLLVFMDESLDPTGAGYNLLQAKIAIGSGGMFGKGLMQGTQGGLGFLPEAPTDFIFCVLAEELGFAGAALLLVMFAVLLAICFWIAFKADDPFGTLIVMGCVGMWIFQIVENIGMTCGLMPITGIPLPFISYGSSSMVTNYMALGLIMSVWAHRSNSAAALAKKEGAQLRENMKEKIKEEL